jgi:hypothetical protein
MFGLQDSSSTFSNANTLATTLSTLLSQNQAVCVATSATPSTLTQKHEYMVDRIFTDSLGRKMVTLRNPWAYDGPGGDSTDDGYVTLTVASLLKDMTKLEWAKAG